MWCVGDLACDWCVVAEVIVADLLEGAGFDGKCLWFFGLLCLACSDNQMVSKVFREFNIFRRRL